MVKNENSASREVAIVNLATTQSVSFNGVQSLLETRSNVALAEREKVYAVDYNFFPGMYTNQFGADYFSLINYTTITNTIAAGAATYMPSKAGTGTIPIWQ